MLYVVTAVHNRKILTREFLTSLSLQSSNNFKVIIVDDASTDGTIEMVEQEFPEVILLKVDGDLWWAETMNVGVRFALQNGASSILTLNDDVILNSDYIEKMIYWAKQKPLALLGSFAINIYDNSPLYGGQIWDWRGGEPVNLLKTIDKLNWHGLHQVNVSIGRGLLIPKEVFLSIGLFDSHNFPQTVADIDFTFRATKSGYKIFCNYDAILKSYPNESSGVQLRTNKSIKNYILHLFSKKGAGNLRYFTIMTFKNCPRKYIPQYLLIGWFRRLFGYLWEWIKNLLQWDSEERQKQ